MAVLGRSGAHGSPRAAQEEQLLAATEALLDEGHAFADLSVERIASRAGAPRTRFYIHFEDKRDLLMKLVGRATGDVFVEADQLVGGRPSGPGEIPVTIETAMRSARRGAAVFRAVVEASAYDPAVGAFWGEQVLDRFVEAVEARIRAQQRAGEALALHPRAAAQALVNMVVATLYQHLREPGDVSDADVAAALTAITVRAIYGAVDGD